MQGFKEFAKKDDYLSTVKSQLKVPKSLWVGMPILLSNTKLGKYRIDRPTMFYVTEFDDQWVTITNVLEVGQPEDGEDDPDNEINVDKNRIVGRIQTTISREDFDDLQQPQTFQGMDTTQLRLGGGF
jgi:hypothetical protein